MAAALLALRVTAGPDVREFCERIAPEAVDTTSDTRYSTSYSLSLLPFGVVCDYSSPASTSLVVDLGTVPLVAGAACLSAGIAALVGTSVHLVSRSRGAAPRPATLSP